MLSAIRFGPSPASLLVVFLFRFPRPSLSLICYSCTTTLSANIDENAQVALRLFLNSVYELPPVHRFCNMEQDVETITTVQCSTPNDQCVKVRAENDGLEFVIRGCKSRVYKPDVGIPQNVHCRTGSPSLCFCKENLWLSREADIERQSGVTSSMHFLVHLAPFLLHFLVRPLTTVSAATTNEDLVEFLFQHQQMCGNPFSDAQWVPVLDLCEIKCDEEREICVENDEMKQRCIKLPEACVRSWVSNKSANLRSSSVVVVTRPPSQKQTPSTGRRASQLATTGQQQQQRHNGREGGGMERRNVGGRRWAPAQTSPKTTTTAMPARSTRMRTEETLTAAPAQPQVEGKAKRGPEEKRRDRWTLIPVKRKEEGKKPTGIGRRGPFILQSVIDLLREE
uniref:Uncharacterized protein n=1 Tax=Globodera rostochiensis TaxID=31243 RepID=A0A914HEV0_GLORO